MGTSNLPSTRDPILTGSAGQPPTPEEALADRFRDLTIAVRELIDVLESQALAIE